MRKRRYIITALFLLATFAIAQKSFAKYVMQDTLTIAICLDKIPPIIDVTSDGKTERFEKTQAHIVKKKDDVTIDTSDNVQIEKNNYQYNPSNSNFDEIEPQEFESGKVFTEEGYYKIITVDTSGNQTEIIFLLDKSAPNVFVQYFKKGETSIVRKSVATTKNLATENVLDVMEENTDENEENSNEVEEDIQQTGENEVIDDVEITEENSEEIEAKEEDIQEIGETEEMINEEILEDTQENNENDEIIEEIEIFETEESEMIENEIMLMSAGDMYVGNEAEFRNALAMQASVIRVRQSIDFTSPIYISYAVTIINEGITNSLRYGNSGNFMIVQNGGFVEINGIVIDGNSSGVGGMTLINIQEGGYVKFVNSSILDGGINNTGILINRNASLELWSCEIVRCNLGVNLQENGKLYFVTQEGRCNNFYWNQKAIFIGNFYGNCDFSQNISIHDNAEYGIYMEYSSGTVNILAGNYYQNTYGIRTCYMSGDGKISISGGSYYLNGWAIWVGGNVNLTGGLIHNNYFGVFLDESYSGSFQMTGGSIYSNVAYAIYHKKIDDGGCTITGGTILGEIYLHQNDNYVNTISSYPTFTVTPSTYYFKRKLVKTANNSVANSEISKVTVTPKDAWYKYVDNEYIVLWSGGNVIARYKDYYGNVIKQEVLNGAIGTNYSLVAPSISGYDLISTPSNTTGFFTQEDIFVDFKYDLVNIAKVTFEDLLSGVVSAKYWYNANSEDFVGEGNDFANGSVFEDYGYYKIVVTNGVGLEKEVSFALNKNSLIR